MQMPVFAKEHDADFVLVDVEGDAEHITGKLQYLLKPYAGKTGNPGDAGGDIRDRPHLVGRHAGYEAFAHAAHSSERAVENLLETLRFHGH